MERIKVSVIIPTYMRSETLPRAIDSVLAQTYSNIQVVVVDDNNPDTEWRLKTSAVMEKYRNNEKVKYVCHDRNMNGSVARNTGINSADGEMVSFLDDDDYYLPTKIQTQVDYLLNNPEFKAVYCGWNRNGDVIPTEIGDLSYNILSGDYIIYTNAIMMWRETAISFGGWDASFLKHQEAAFLLRFFKSGGLIGCVPEVLVCFDISDRTNAVKEPRKNEENVCHFLDSFADVINSQTKKSKRNIFIHRYRGVLLFYLKTKHIFGAISFYFRKCLKYHFLFIADFVSYAAKKGKSHGKSN